MTKQYRTIEDLIADLLTHTEVKNENGDRLENLEYSGRDSDDWVSISKGDLQELIQNAFINGAFQR